MEKFIEIIKKMDSIVCMFQKKKKVRVFNFFVFYFVMFFIYEDNLEKVFDFNVFIFGLGKKKESQLEMLSVLQLMQNFDFKFKLRFKRTSVEQSVFFKFLYIYTNGKDEFLVILEVNDKESKDVINGGVKRFRLEKSVFFLSMLFFLL